MTVSGDRHDLVDRQVCGVRVCADRLGALGTTTSMTTGAHLRVRGGQRGELILREHVDPLGHMLERGPPPACRRPP
jgi:hypothetical protein